MKQLTLLLCTLLFFKINSFAQPANDLCSNATPINVIASCGGTSGTLSAATSAGSPISQRGTTTNDVWYVLNVASAANALIISIPTRGTSLTNTNSFFEVYNTSTCAGLTIGNSLASSNTAAANTITLANVDAGSSYLVRVFTTTASPTGVNWTFTICATAVTTAPANDNCAGSVLLTPETASTGNVSSGATASVGVPAVCAGGGTADDDVWFRFVATTSNATVTVFSSSIVGSLGAMIQLFSGTCGALTSIGCGQGSFTASGLTAGQTYYIRVYSFPATGVGGAVAAPTANATFNIGVMAGTPTNVTAGRMNEVFQLTNLSIRQLVADPWEILYGPDNYLWVTEAKSYKVYRINPATGEKITVLDLAPSSKSFSTPAHQAFYARFSYHFSLWPQGGMAGLALHPGFTGSSGGQNFVYLSYVHSYNGGSSPTGNFFTNRLIRLTYNTSTGLLESPETICDTLPGSNDHNSQRIIIAKEGGVDYLFYASGDVGAGQFGNRTRPMKSQNYHSYEGKILRFNLAPTGSGTGLDPWIPNDNPYSNVPPVTGKSAVWVTGIRNNQGFAYNSDLNILYGSSHGPYSDDEINIIERSKNYGHPLVIGYNDGNYNGTTTPGLSTSVSAGAAFADNSGNSSCPPIGNENTNVTTINNNAATLASTYGLGTGFGAYKDAMFSAYPSNQSTISGIWGATPSTPGNGGWPSEGWSGLDLYTHTLIPGWKNSLIAASLKWGRLVRMKLNAAGTGVLPIGDNVPVGTKDTASYFGSQNRFRDIAFAPNGRDIYVIMDRSTSTSGPSAANPVVPNCEGCIQRYTFLGYNDNAGTSTIPTSIPIDSSTSAGCVTATAVTINANNNNNNLWVPITGPNGNIIAEIDANGNNLGNVTTSFFTRTGAPVRSWGANHYVNRNVTINVQTQPLSPVSVRLYITAKELADIIATPGSGITTINDIGVFKNADACGTTFGNNPETGQAITGRYVQSTFGHALQFNVTSFSTFYFFNSSATLPFELITLNGKPVNDAARLEWIVKNEKDVNNYTIERSVDGVQFTEIGSVTSKNGTGELKYQFTDFNAAKTATVVYYRIRSNEASGVGKYTNTISVSFAIVLKTSLAVAPNPAKDKTTVTIQSTADETVQLKVIDNTGRMIKVLTVNLVKGKNNLTLDMSDLKAGMYYIDMTGKSINEKTKLIKQ